MGQHKQDRATVKRIDRTDAQKMAGNGYLDMLQSQAAAQFEALVIKTKYGGESIDYTMTPVDGGPIWVEIPSSVIDAHKRLGEASRHIGKIGYAIVHKFTCDGLSAAEIAQQFGEAGDRAERHYRKRYRDDLTLLADLWFPTKAKRRRNFYSRQEIAQIAPDLWEPLEDD